MRLSLFRFFVRGSISPGNRTWKSFKVWLYFLTGGAPVASLSRPQVTPEGVHSGATSLLEKESLCVGNQYLQLVFELFNETKFVSVFRPRGYFSGE